MKPLCKKILLRASISLPLGILAVVLIAAVFVGSYGYHPPILMYHHVLPEGGDRSKLVVDLAYFEQQMAYLKKENYQVLPLDQLFLLVLNHKPLPGKSVAITFDDGYEDNYTYAYPILKKFQFPATFFLIAGKIGKKDYLSWDQISEMASDKIQFGNHTLTHPNLTEIDRADVRKEIYDAQSILNAKLRSLSPIFAYPSGFYNEIAVEEVKQMNYLAAVSASPTEDLAMNNRYGFNRVRISNSSKNTRVFWITISGYYPALRKLKYRVRQIRKSLFNKNQ